MTKYDLSILIPARNEMFLSRTVENILQNIRGNTEIIVVLDGQWANPGIKEDPRLTIVYRNTPIGQRAATNEAARLSHAKYVMKIDAHCVVDEGFDVKMMAEMHDDWTMVPTMYNLHAFDWVCTTCGHRIYQSPTPEKCPQKDCTGKMERDIIFQPRFSRKSNYYRFDKTLHFQYWGEYGNRPEVRDQDIVDVMSIQGSCFMLTRDKYWELNICDEKHGSWGQQGVEVACKTWLSGGRLVVNKKTWYSHMFRTQGGDFGFPYPLSASDVEKARAYSRELWLQNTWPLAKHDLNWLVEKFKPVPDWHTYEQPKKPKKGIVYYSHNVGDPLILETCRKQITKGMKEKHIVSVTSQPVQFGHNIVLPTIKEPKYLDMFTKILTGLKASDADVIFFCEHDVLYHPSHFDFVPPRQDKYYYNTNVWRVRYADGHGLYCDDLQQLSGLVAYRTTLIKHFEERIRRSKDGYSTAMGFEPGTHGRPERIDDLKAESYRSAFPNIDIRHDTNSTANRWSKEQFRNERYTRGWKESSDIPGWGMLKDRMSAFLTSL